MEFYTPCVINLVCSLLTFFIFLRTAELDSFTEKQKKLKNIIQDLESELKEKLKECEKLQNDLEVARNDTQVETDSQLTVQAQLKNEIKEILVENAELKSQVKSKGEKVKNLEEKCASADKDKISLLSKTVFIFSIQTKFQGKR